MKQSIYYIEYALHITVLNVFVRRSSFIVGIVSPCGLGEVINYIFNKLQVIHLKDLLGSSRMTIEDKSMQITIN